MKGLRRRLRSDILTYRIRDGMNEGVNDKSKWSSAEGWEAFNRAGMRHVVGLP